MKQFVSNEKGKKQKIRLASGFNQIGESNGNLEHEGTIAKGSKGKALAKKKGILGGEKKRFVVVKRNDSTSSLF